jgi:hypothetical protein
MRTIHARSGDREYPLPDAERRPPPRLDLGDLRKPKAHPAQALKERIARY